MCAWVAHLKKTTSYFGLHSQRKSCMAKPLLGVWETSGPHELLLRWVGRKHDRLHELLHGCVGSQLSPGRWPSSLTALWHHCQAITPGAQPAHEGHEPWFSLCLSGASVMAELGFDFGGKGGEQLPGVRLPPAPLHGRAVGSSWQIKGRGIHQGGDLTKILCSPAHWQQTLYKPLSRGVAGSPALFGRKVWQDLCDG